MEVALARLKKTLKLEEAFMWFDQNGSSWGYLIGVGLA